MRTKLSTTTAALAFLAAGAFGGSVAGAGTASAVGTNTPAMVSASAAVEPTLREQADSIMNLTYREFAETPRIPPFNWTNDGCSAPTGNAPYVEVFRPACAQHDFGYRNYGGRHELKLSPTRETKNWIDGRFRTEMRHICDDTYRLPMSHLSCVNAAEAYYTAVQFGGDSSFF
ncbi:phospholipase A2 [Streptomyces sp. TRM49041]|uniref:phospholipase A2 n=1 Tax=Streptomyces sp. TRM49041 TaxID=2603216 RepID=UPI0011ED8915|nr:phospholipase A2 [Streptomyces sp. TRM49041]